MGGGMGLRERRMLGGESWSIGGFFSQGAARFRSGRGSLPVFMFLCAYTVGCVCVSGFDGKIDLTKLNVQQLHALKQQLSAEERMLVNSHTQLRLAQSQFHESRAVLKTLNPKDIGNPVLVPITTSLFVEGTLADTKKVLVDVGTGYFVEKDLEEADDYFKRKVDYVQENLKRVEANVLEKRKVVSVVSQCMQMKVEEQQKAEKAGKAG